MLNFPVWEQNGQRWICRSHEYFSCLINVLFELNVCIQCLHLKKRLFSGLGSFGFSMVFNFFTAEHTEKKNNTVRINHIENTYCHNTLYYSRKKKNARCKDKKKRKPTKYQYHINYWKKNHKYKIINTMNMIDKAIYMFG